MSEIETFLQQLDETERLAKEATPGPWSVKEIDGRSVMSESRMVVAAVAAREQWPIAEDAQHIARHDPAWALRWVAAVREILRVHLPVDGVCQTCSFDEESDRLRSRDYPENEPYPCPTVRALMSVYQEEGS